MNTRPRGRPPLDPRYRSVNVNVRITSSQYDAVYAKARADRLTIAQWIRRALQSANRPARSTDGGL